MHERPLSWTPAQLLRRIGHSVDTFSDAELDQACQISGTSQGKLRKMHLDNEAPPLLLSDSLDRISADRQARAASALPDETAAYPTLFERFYQAGLTEDPLRETLQLHTPRLSKPLANRLLTASERAHWMATGEPSATLLDNAAQIASELPLTRALEGVYFPALASADSERLLFTCLGRLPGWSPKVCLELRAGTPQGPLLTRLGAAGAAERRVIVKSLDGYRAYDGTHPVQTRAVNPLDNDLPRALLHALPDARRQALGLSLEQPEALLPQVKAFSASHRSELPQWLWSHRPSSWSESGRLLGGMDQAEGYPAAQPDATSVMTRYRALYPATSEVEAQTAIERWTAESKVPTEELQHLEARLARLQSNLRAWSGNLERRQSVATELVRAWQRISLQVLPSGASGVRLKLARLGLTEADLASFPVLSETLAEVHDLDLGSNPLVDLPQTFIQHFPALQRLSLTRCDLTRIPRFCGAQLKNLDLSLNRIAWSPDQQPVLDSYSALLTLDLSLNPLQRAPQFSALPQLDYLDLSACELVELPTGLDALRDPLVIDLTENDISHLPADFQPPRAVGEALRLEQNPLGQTALTYMDDYFSAHGVDLLVGEVDYEGLLDGTTPAQQALWRRLKERLPISYRRGLRELYETDEYLAAPATSRRRYWRLLAWMDSNPGAMQRALQVDAGGLLELEFRFEVDRAMAEPEPQARAQTLLRVYTRLVRENEVAFALPQALPDFVEDTALEELNQWTLQHLAQDPELDLPLAPTPDERVTLDLADGLEAPLTAQWREQLRERLLQLSPANDQGLDALFVRDTEEEYHYSGWVDWLRQRYSNRFDALRTTLDAELEHAETLSEGDYVNEARRLRDAFTQNTDALLRSLTRGVLEGTLLSW